MVRLSHADIILEVKTAILERGPTEQPSIIEVARQLHVSVRTLQRHLSNWGIDYSFLLDAVRFEIAKSLLLDPTLQIAEIGRRLGYRDPSSFSRAFLRWSGSSPRSWRRAQHVRWASSTS